MQPEEWIGQTLARTYLIEAVLGAGGMGAVFRARHLRTHGLVAVKLLKPDVATETDLLRRFHDEARVIAALRHPHIVQVHDFHDADGSPDIPVPFLVMDLLEGEDLHSRLRRCKRLSYAEARKLAQEVGSALQATHNRNIVHRDIKPMNLFIHRHEEASSDEEIYKVVDFGISKIQGHSRRTPTLTFMGTPHYAAPESASGRGDTVDARSDQFSLAVVLYRALSGRVPFDGKDGVGILYQVVYGSPEPIEVVVPDLPKHAALAIGRAMSKDKNERFVSIAEFAQAFCGSTRSLSSGLPRLAPLAPEEATIRSLPVAMDFNSQVVRLSAQPLVPSSGVAVVPEPVSEASRLTPHSLSPSSVSLARRRSWSPSALGLFLGLIASGTVAAGVWFGRTSRHVALPHSAHPNRETVATAPSAPQAVSVGMPGSRATGAATGPVSAADAATSTIGSAPAVPAKLPAPAACAANYRIAVLPSDDYVEKQIRKHLRKKGFCEWHTRGLRFQRTDSLSRRFVLQQQAGASVTDTQLEGILEILKDSQTVPREIREVQIGGAAVPRRAS